MDVITEPFIPLLGLYFFYCCLTEYFLVQLFVWIFYFGTVLYLTVDFFYVFVNSAVFYVFFVHGIS